MCDKGQKPRYKEKGMGKKNQEISLKECYKSRAQNCWC